ncbi:MAG: hypothetical protein H0V17_13805 [Deltaproteobacteria bacterium]|nr:hypothetical protein [Deltaproteobacteria bacterium]
MLLDEDEGRIVSALMAQPRWHYACEVGGFQIERTIEGARTTIRLATSEALARARWPGRPFEQPAPGAICSAPPVDILELLVPLAFEVLLLDHPGGELWISRGDLVPTLALCDRCARMPPSYPPKWAINFRVIGTGNTREACCTECKAWWLAQATGDTWTWTRNDPKTVEALNLQPVFHWVPPAPRADPGPDRSYECPSCGRSVVSVCPGCGYR